MEDKENTPPEQEKRDDETVMFDDKVKFDEKQQAAVNKIVQERLARQRAVDDKKHAADLAAQEARLRAELTSAASVVPANSGDLRTGVTDDDDNESGAAPAAAASPMPPNAPAAPDAVKPAVEPDDDPRIKLLETENRILRKDSALLSAVCALPFIDPRETASLLEVLVELDEEPDGTFVVTQDGVVQQGADLKPLSLVQFVERFAAERPHLVRGQVKGGTGSAENRGFSRTAIRTKADAHSVQERVAYINKHGLRAWERLPLR